MKKRVIILFLTVVFFLVSGVKGYKTFSKIAQAKSSMSEVDSDIEDKLKDSDCVLDPAQVYNDLAKLDGVQSIDTIFDLNLKSSKFEVDRELRGGDVSALKGVHLLEIYITPKDVKTLLNSLKNSKFLISSMYVDTGVVIRVYVKR